MMKKCLPFVILLVMSSLSCSSTLGDKKHLSGLVPFHKNGKLGFIDSRLR